MQYSKQDYLEMLELPSAVVTTLSEGSQIIGYSLAYSIDDGIDDLIEHGDNDIEEYRGQPTTAYLETLAINPEYQNTGSFKSFYIECLEALRAAGYTKLLMHARQSTLSPLLKNKNVFGYSPKRVVTDWLEGEDFDFYEIDLR